MPILSATCSLGGGAGATVDADGQLYLLASGDASACSGDSGGPVFYGGFESNLIVAVTSFGLNASCRGVDFSYRAGQQAVLDWIRDTVGESTWADITIVSI